MKKKTKKTEGTDKGAPEVTLDKWYAKYDQIKDDFKYMHRSRFSGLKEDLKAKFGRIKGDRILCFSADGYAQDEKEIKAITMSISGWLAAKEYPYKLRYSKEKNYFAIIPRELIGKRK